jgi:branched-chain amino acid transport system substrate-binding protein
MIRGRDHRKARPHWLTVVALVALMAAACGGGEALEENTAGGSGAVDAGENEAANTPVKVGLLVPTSGVYTTLGEDMKRGFQLYLDQNGGRLGGREVKVVVADEGAGPETGVPAGQRLVSRDRVDIATGIVNSAVALGLRDVYTEAKVPLILSNAGAEALTGSNGSDYLWRTSFGNGDPNRAFGRWLAAQPDVPGGVFLLGADYAAGKENLGGFKETYLAGGGKLAGEIYTPFGTTSDFGPFLTQVRSAKPGAVYVFYAGQEAVTFVRQYAEFGLQDDIPLYGSGFLTEGGVLAAQGQAAVGIRTGLHYSSEVANPVNEKFVTAYREVYDAVPTVYAVQAYDAAYVIDEAVGRLDGRLSGPRLVAALGRIGGIDSPRGEWRFSDTHNPEQPFYLREVQEVEGKLVNAVVEELGTAGGQSKPG